MDALHRTVHASYGIAVRMAVVRTRLSPRPYHRAWWIWPGTAHAAPLAPSLLTAWDEARIMLRFDVGTATYPVGGIVVTGADGPAVPALLAPMGWKTLALPKAIAQASPRSVSALGRLLPHGRVAWVPGQWIDPGYPVPHIDPSPSRAESVSLPHPAAEGV